MTTKEQERKALEQIKKIVAGLGDESYVGKAFEGCFEMAQDNIENDFWNSWKTLCEHKDKELDKAVSKLNDKAEEIIELKKRAERAEQLYNSTQKAADSWCTKCHEANDVAIANWNKFREQEDRAGALEQEVIKLKAKLYDLIVK